MSIETHFDTTTVTGKAGDKTVNLYKGESKKAEPQVVKMLVELAKKASEG